MDKDMSKRFPEKELPFKLALNTSTLLPYKLDVKEQIRVTAEAGYEGIELWVRDIEAYLANGGSLAQLKRYIEDTGLTVINGIAFFKWTDADPSTKAEGLIQAEKEMNMLAEIGCQAVAAPPTGEVSTVSLSEMAENFFVLAEKARAIGIEPVLEFWGRAVKLNKISEAMYVAIHSGVSDVKVLFDLFHMYTGGSRVEDLELVKGNNIGVVHVNDYPAEPSQAVIADSDRVFPGDGVGATEKFAQLLHQAGYQGYLSLELFRASYGDKDAVELAKFGLEKVRTAYSI